MPPEFQAPRPPRAHHTQITLSRLSSRNVRTEGKRSGRTIFEDQATARRVGSKAPTAASNGPAPAWATAGAADRLPPAIVWRRDKRGFSTPEARLLRNELRPRVDELLAPSAEMVRRGLVDPLAARARFAAFLRGSHAVSQAVASRDIFQLVSLELWLRAYRENLSG